MSRAAGVAEGSPVNRPAGVADQVYDVLVIGGGITGVSVARDCALRGLSTALVERDDFASGTTGTCMGMLHGGLQYLMTNPELTRLECAESGIMQKAAPHLTFPIPFLYVIREEEKVGVWEALFAYYDEFQKAKFGRPHLTLSEPEALEIEPSLRPGFAAALTNDEPGVDVFRLNVLVARDAAGHGAVLANHTEVTGLLLEGGPPERGRVAGARVRDCLTGSTAEIRARITVNAAGPWVPRVTAMAGLSYRLRPTKGIHLIVDRRLTSVGVTCYAIDGRSFCLLPHENTTLIGTTDDDYFSDEDEVSVDHQEVEYLLTSLETVLPGIRGARVIRAMAGLRPTLYQYGLSEDKVTRDFEVWDHLERDGLDGFLTIAGGKMTIARVMAERVTDAVVARLGRDPSVARCLTAERPLPGGDRTLTADEIRGLASEHGVSVLAAARLAARHGNLAPRVLAEGCRRPGGRAVICVCEPVLEAEIRYVARHEWVRTLDDLRRRVRLGMGPCQGLGCSAEASAVLGLELDRSPAEARSDLERFRQARWKGQRGVLDGHQLRQQEVNQGAWLHDVGREVGR